jgi:hypothetical protein
MYTKNNSVSMNTVVETYVVPETQVLIYDNEKLTEWRQRVDELGLKGQATLTVEGKSPTPFLYMNQGLVHVFEVLCPKKVKITEYSRTPIPLEILELVQLSKSEGYFTKIEVWSNETEPDPVVIGFAEADGDAADWNLNKWNRYLIGRWGDVRQSLEQLTAKAKALFREKEISQAQRTIRSYQERIDNIDYYVNDHFKGTHLF